MAGRLHAELAARNERVARSPNLVRPARLKLALLNPQALRKVGIVAAHLLDEPLRVLAPDERLDSVPERVDARAAMSTIAYTITL